MIADCLICREGSSPLVARLQRSISLVSLTPKNENLKNRHGTQLHKLDSNYAACYRDSRSAIPTPADSANTRHVSCWKTVTSCVFACLSSPGGYSRIPCSSRLQGTCSCSGPSACRNATSSPRDGCLRDRSCQPWSVFQMWNRWLQASRGSI